MRKRSGVLFVCALSSLMLYAEDQPLPFERGPVEELFLSTMIYPQLEGEWQLSLTPAFMRSGDEREWEFPFEVEYGLNDHVQLSLEWETFKGLRDDQKHWTWGTSDVELSAQYSFMNIKKSHAHVALEAGLRLPAGSVNREMTDGNLGARCMLLLGWDPRWGRGMHLFSQAGVELKTRLHRPEDWDGSSEPHEFVWNSGVVMPWKTFALSAEFTLISDKWNRDGDETSLYITPGITWKPVRDWEIGLGVPVGLNRDADDYGVVFKIVYEFGDKD